MEDCATPKMRFETPASLALEATFDDGKLTSDGGLLWLSEVDEELGFCAKPWPSTSQNGERGKDTTPW